jgi:hypothetical protein
MPVDLPIPLHWSPLAPAKIFGTYPGPDRLRAVIRTNRWLLPAVLAILVVGAVIGALVH